MVNRLMAQILDPQCLLMNTPLRELLGKVPETHPHQGPGRHLGKNPRPSWDILTIRELTTF
jgi:hypothetical protein